MENYHWVGIAEISSEDVTAYYWGDETSGHAIQSPFYVLLLERGDASAGTVRR